MDNERFLNAYVEILTNTFHDALNKNIVYQAQAKITNEDVETYKQKIDGLQTAIEEYNNIQQTIEEKDHELVNKNAELGRLKSEYEHAKSETSHLNTFKNELVSARQELQNKIKEIQELNVKFEKEKEKEKIKYENIIQGLNDKIEYLQMTPAQRRKFDAKNNKTVIDTLPKPEVVIENSRDGGTF